MIIAASAYDSKDKQEMLDKAEMLVIDLLRQDFGRCYGIVLEDHFSAVYEVHPNDCLARERQRNCIERYLRRCYEI